MDLDLNRGVRQVLEAVLGSATCFENNIRTFLETSRLKVENLTEPFGLLTGTAMVTPMSLLEMEAQSGFTNDFFMVLLGQLQSWCRFMPERGNCRVALKWLIGMVTEAVIKLLINIIITSAFCLLQSFLPFTFDIT